MFNLFFYIIYSLGILISCSSDIDVNTNLRVVAHSFPPFVIEVDASWYHPNRDNIAGNNNFTCKAGLCNNSTGFGVEIFDNLIQRYNKLNNAFYFAFKAK